MKRFAEFLLRHLANILRSDIQTSGTLNITVRWDDPLYVRAKKIILKERKLGHTASFSLLRQKLKISSTRVFCILERMEREDLILPPDKHGKRVIIACDAPMKPLPQIISYRKPHNRS